jgi:hypothetical protein
MAARTPSHFVTLNQASQASKVLAKIDADPSMAMVCFNDDARRNQEERHMYDQTVQGRAA